MSGLLHFSLNVMKSIFLSFRFERPRRILSNESFTFFVFFFFGQVGGLWGRGRVGGGGCLTVVGTVRVCNFMAIS